MSRAGPPAVDPSLTPDDALARLRRTGEASLLLDGRGGDPTAWETLVAVGPEEWRGGATLEAIAARSRARRSRGGGGGTGLAVLLPYELLDPRGRERGAPHGARVLEIDASIRFGPEGPVGVGAAPRWADLRAGAPEPAEAAPRGAPRTSLPRAAYLAAVERAKAHIARGDIYQANVTQRLERPFVGDPWRLYRSLARATPAPRSAFVEGRGWALASVSPETFIDVTRAGVATTLPIKGTRPRHAARAADAAAADALLASAKDRAELTMIVDLERNDLGRIARIGTVCVRELAALRSYAAVHHLVGVVEAELADGVGFDALVRATFPGGSITGAPKRRAMEILASIEPTPRGLYTGCLFWLDDDGSTRSSILIRSVEIGDGIASVGAGGGIVAESDADEEWMESNAKARALTRALGFEPEEAS